MFKKLLSALTVMLFVCGFAGAQNFAKVNYGMMMPKFAAGHVMTSKVELGGSEFWTGYWNGEINDQTSLVGVQQTPMDYGVAVLYPAGDAITKEKTIEGIKFGFPDATNITNVRVFIGTSLPSLNGDADICTDVVEEITDINNQDGDYLNEVRFSKPYKVDASKPVYVGYMFNVAKGNGQGEKFPILIQGGEDKKNALLLNFADQGWDDYVGNGFGVAAMQVLMSGEFADNDISMDTNLGSVVGSTGSTNIDFAVSNAGNNGISSFSIEVKAGDVVTTADITPKNTVMGIGTKYPFTMTVNTPNEPGNYDLTATLTKLNGETLAEPIVAKGQIMVLSKLIERKVMVEEFTGMWCGWCPRGFVALEKIKQVYGERVTTIAVHNGDALECKDYSKVVKMVAGFPGAIVDRAIFGIDPYYGSSQAEFGMSGDIDSRLAIAPVANVVVKGTIDGDILTATAETEFFYTGDASKYAVAFVVREDGMKNDKWAQANNYTQFKGQGLETIEPLFEPWVNGKSQMKGVEYNEVAIAAKGIDNGIQGSIPATVNADEINSFSQEFDLTKYKKIINRDNLSVIAVLFNTVTGEIENTSLASLNPNSTGIEEVAGNADVKEVARYSVDGARIDAAQKGINIVKYSDGTVKKVLVK